MHSEWTCEQLAGKPAQVFEPESAAPFALLFLPDTDAIPDVLPPLLHSLRLRCVVPSGAASWWLDRDCPEFDAELSGERFLLDAVIPWMRSRWNLTPNAIGVAGIGVGGQGAVRLGFRHPDRIRVVASLNGAFDFHERHGRGTSLDEMYETKERARQATAILQLDPTRWPPHTWFACDPGSEWYRGNDRLHEKLTAYGVPHITDLDHPPRLDSMLQFLLNGLKRESRRLM